MSVDLVAPPQPRHTHDCDVCEFLGIVDGTNPYDCARSEEFDLWYCPKCDEGTLIARYGSDGEYMSWPIAMIRRVINGRRLPHPALAWALTLFDHRRGEPMSDLDKTTELWVLQAKVEAYEKALAALTSGVRGMALTLRTWAVAAGGHTPSAIIASRLLELIGDEKPPAPTEALPK